MPEFVEHKAVSDFLEKLGKKRIIIGFIKNKERIHPYEKVLFEGFDKIFKKYSTVHFDSTYYGKTFLLKFYHPHQENFDEILNYYFSLRFTANFYIFKKKEDFPKYWNFAFLLDNNSYLVFWDKRKLCNITKEKLKERSYCIGVDHEKWYNQIANDLDTDNYRVKSRMFDYIMRQDRFNGIGNYLRAEILGRINCNPFTLAKDYLKDNLNILAKTIIKVYEESFDAGGFQGEDWKNPLYSQEEQKTKQEEFFKWTKFYRKGSKTKDRNGRTFWFDPKWDHKIKSINSKQNHNLL
jgi:endonuclease VIII-like 1